MGRRVDRSVGLVQRTVLRGSFIQFALSVSMFLPVNLDALIADPCTVLVRFLAQRIMYSRHWNRTRHDRDFHEEFFFPRPRRRCRDTLHERRSASGIDPVERCREVSVAATYRLDSLSARANVDTLSGVADPDLKELGARVYARPSPRLIR